MTTTTFTEKQRMFPLWAIAALGLFTLLSLWFFIGSFFPATNHQNIDGDPTIGGLIGGLAFGAIFLLSLRANLSTHINANGLEVAFSPFAKKVFIPWQDIAETALQDNSKKYNEGMFGVSKSDDGIRYKVHAKYRLYIKRTNDKDLWIDTQQKDALQQVLEALGR
jgi:hypothetical protein